MNSITNPGANRLTIGQLSATSGVNIETIRYYERIRLLEPPPRTPGGHRSYNGADVSRLRFVRRARELGFGIDDIRALLALARHGSASCSEVRDIAAAHLIEIRAKLEDLRKLEGILAGTVAECDCLCETTSAPVCPVIEVLQS
jgi:MerR family transcriptional regulator, mercuric resistance operon regulatory protein